jgi:tetratricopeptide (TPR) repeat protein
MQKNIISLTLFGFLLFPLISFGENTENLAINENQSVAELLKNGAEFYHKKSFIEAEEVFKVAASKEPKNYVALYNWGLSLFQLDKKPLAVAVLRKAHNLSPEQTQIEQALEFTLSTMGFNPVSFNSDSGEYFRTKILQHLTLNSALGIWTLLLFLSGWFLLNYMGQRIRSIKNEKPLPQFPIAAGFFLALWLLSSLVSVTKAIDINTTRATIILEKAPILAGPSQDQLTLFELSGGSEVIIQIQSKDWVQIKAVNTGTDGMSGWISESSIMKTSVTN